MIVKNISEIVIFTETEALLPGYEGECTKATGAILLERKVAEEVKPERKTRSDKGSKRASHEEKQEQLEENAD